MRDLFNLVVDLDARFEAGDRAMPAGIAIDASAAADGRTLAWIDAEFGGAWSSEAHAGTNVLAFRESAPVGFATYDPKGLRFAWLRGLGSERDVGIFGPFGIESSERGTGLGRMLLHSALARLRARGYARALIPAVGGDDLIRYYGDAAGARVAERFDGRQWVSRRPRVVVMASGTGTNLQTVLDRARAGTLPVDVVALVVNNERAFATERARQAGVPSVVVLPWKRKDEARSDYDARLLESVREQRPDLILLLGWMHLLSADFVSSFELLNLHPGFLPLDPERDEVTMPDGDTIPAFRGSYAVRDALAYRSRWVGATVHRVTADTDRGPVMVREPLRVGAEEGEEDVMKRLHRVEHGLVPAAVMRWIYEREGSAPIQNSGPYVSS